MKSVTNRAFMAKKQMYKQPETDVTNLTVANLMLTVSEGGEPNDPTNPPVVGAPKRTPGPSTQEVF